MAQRIPFTIVYDTIVAEFKKDHDNVISYDTIRGPKKDVLTNSDLPELAVVPDTAALNLGNASCDNNVVLVFQVMVKTGDQRLNESAFPVMWKLVKAYWRLRYGTPLNSLQFNGRNFITDITVGTATLDLGAADRGILGWACLWPITVYMSFIASDLS